MGTTIYADGQTVQQAIALAIRDSIDKDQTVRIVARDTSQLRRDLFAECDADSENDGEHLFWGVNLDGDEWSVAVELDYPWS